MEIEKSIYKLRLLKSFLDQNNLKKESAQLSNSIANLEKKAYMPNVGLSLLLQELYGDLVEDLFSVKGCPDAKDFIENNHMQMLDIASYHFPLVGVALDAGFLLTGLQEEDPNFLILLASALGIAFGSKEVLNDLKGLPKNEAHNLLSRRSKNLSPSEITKMEKARDALEHLSKKFKTSGVVRFVGRKSQEFLEYIKDGLMLIFRESKKSLDKIRSLKRNFSNKDLEDIAEIFLNDFKGDDVYVIEIVRGLDEFAKSVKDMSSYSHKVSANRGYHVMPEDIQEVVDIVSGKIKNSKGYSKAIKKKYPGLDPVGVSRHIPEETIDAFRFFQREAGPIAVKNRWPGKLQYMLGGLSGEERMLIIKKFKDFLSKKSIIFLNSSEMMPLGGPGHLGSTTKLGGGDVVINIDLVNLSLASKYTKGKDEKLDLLIDIMEEEVDHSFYAFIDSVFDSGSDFLRQNPELKKKVRDKIPEFKSKATGEYFRRFEDEFSNKMKELEDALSNGRVGPAQADEISFINKNSKYFLSSEEMIAKINSVRDKFRNMNLKQKNYLKENAGFPRNLVNNSDKEGLLIYIVKNWSEIKDKSGLIKELKLTGINEDFIFFMNALGRNIPELQIDQIFYKYKRYFEQ